MASIKVSYSTARSACDPHETPVTIIGQVKNLNKVSYDDVKCKLEPRVDKQTWVTSLEMLNPHPTDSVSMYLNRATVAALPTKCSRHNTPSRAHSITKIVKSCSSGQLEHIVIVCQRSDVYASGCAVARAFSLYSRKTAPAVNSDEYSTAAKVPKVRTHEVLVEFVVVDDPNGGVTANDVETLEQSATAIQLSARIVDTPCNEMHTDQFIEEVRVVAKNLGLHQPLVIQGEELNDRGIGGIYGVGKAAVHKPALVVLSHTPENATQTVAWVGKGIVYDTGGLSIKGKTAMPGMKRDCGGAAGILGAFHVAVSQGFQQNLHAIFCLAENAVSDRATRPDDIHTLYSGKTVEINNTDAEGRLVVSDGVVYANRDLGADIIVDMCTLTGAQGISTGRYHAAHLTNNETWEQYCAEAGKASGDLSFPLVYCPELHFPEFTSAVADMKNSVADRSNAQSSCAGLFINAHLGFDYPGVWLHVDMASPVHTGERATGYGVALLNTLFGQFSKSSLLQQACPISMENGEDEGVRSKKMRTE